MRIQESEKILKDVKKSYHKLSEMVGGFSKEQAEIILPICIKNTLINNGVKEKDIKRMELF